MCSFFITTIGWFAWLSFLDGVYAPGPDGPYLIRHTFTRVFGVDAVWWSTLFIVLAFLGLIELVGKSVKRNMLVAGMWHWPPWKKQSLDDIVEEWDLQVWQEMEQDPEIRERLRRLANDEETMDDIEAEDAYNVEARMDG